jgi:cytochrome c biogenesis protein CcmG, thiol:disulfide interchange protein DsbE
MKKALVIVVMLAVASFGIEKTFPKFTLQDLSGKNVSLDSLLTQGKPILLTFWATWCKPCRKELQKISEYWDKDKTEHKYIVVAVCEDGPRSAAQAQSLANTENWNKFKLPHDKAGELKKKAGVADIPELFLIKPDGSIYFRHIGYNPGDEKETFEKLEKLILEVFPQK